MAADAPAIVDAFSFYGQYHGHPVRSCGIVERELRKDHEGLIFFAGDSSLDNKYWFGDEAPAVNGYERILRPPTMRQDVSYHANKILAERAPRWAAVNTAIEATSLNDRAFGTLLAQDALLRDRITEDDVLVISVGGNDIALAPLLCTCFNIVPLLCAGAVCGDALDACACACPPDVYTPTRGRADCGCAGCGLPGCVAGVCGWPCGLGYFVDLFKNRTSAYAHNLTAKRKPRLVIVCMIYYLDVDGRGSWADATLRGLCYDARPALLQRAIRHVYERGTRRVAVDGTVTLALPLFEVLDGSDTADYVQRVEPSARGSAKLAAAIVEAVLNAA